MAKELQAERSQQLLAILGERFKRNMNRHEGIAWDDVLVRLESNAVKMWSLNEMEETGGEPDVVGKDAETGRYVFYDCSPESPSGRRSLCYDRKALDARKANKPEDSAMDLADAMGIEMLTEEQYRILQQFGKFDTKTSSWLVTPGNIRKLGGAIFGDYRYETIFIYHNGADSYYAARGFRGVLTV